LRRARQPFWKIAREAGLSLGPVARIAKAKRLSRLSALNPRIEIIRYEKKQPGERAPQKVPGPPVERVAADKKDRLHSGEAPLVPTRPILNPLLGVNRAKKARAKFSARA
jgi:hypothetical protein